MSNSVMTRKVQKARALANPLKGLGPYMEIELSNNETHDDDSGLELPSAVLEVKYRKSPLPRETLKGCMALFTSNMAEMYKASNWGLDLEKKMEELDHEHARFLLVKAGEEFVGFLHFRFDVNDDEVPTEEVLYVHEIQIAQNYTGRGIGRRLMAIMEVVAMRTDMKKVMLTVFSANAAAYRFYTVRMNYVIDPISPSQNGVKADYEILSKKDLMKAAA